MIAMTSRTPSLDKIHPQTVRAMDEQIHKISVCIDPAYRKAMDFLQDEHLLDMEERRPFLHSIAQCNPILSFSSLLAECRHLCAPLCFQLVLRDNTYLLLLLTSLQSSRLWTLLSSYNQSVFTAWHTERKRQQDLSALQTQRFHLACNTIDSGGTAPRVPAYPSSELEPWTKHLDSVSRACIHFERLHLEKVISETQQGRKRDTLESILVEMRKSVQMSCRADLWWAQPQ
eukprot:2487186-Rhodomonas_salina.1